MLIQSRPMVLLLSLTPIWWFALPLVLAGLFASTTLGQSVTGVYSLNGVSLFGWRRVAFETPSGIVRDSIGQGPNLAHPNVGPFAEVASSGVVFPDEPIMPGDEARIDFLSRFEFGTPFGTGTVEYDTWSFWAEGSATAVGAMLGMEPASAVAHSYSSATFFVDSPFGEPAGTVVGQFVFDAVRPLTAKESALGSILNLWLKENGEIRLLLEPGSPSTSYDLAVGKLYELEASYFLPVPHGVDPPFLAELSGRIVPAPPLPYGWASLNGQTALWGSLDSWAVGNNTPNSLPSSDDIVNLGDPNVASSSIVVELFAPNDPNFVAQAGTVNSWADNVVLRNGVLEVTDNMNIYQGILRLDGHATATVGGNVEVGGPAAHHQAEVVGGSALEVGGNITVKTGKFQVGDALAGVGTASIDGTLHLRGGEVAIRTPEDLPAPQPGSQVTAAGLTVDGGLLLVTDLGTSFSTIGNAIVGLSSSSVEQKVRVENGANVDIAGNLTHLSGEIEIANAELIVGSGPNGGNLTIGGPNQVEPPPPLHITEGGSLHALSDVEVWGTLSIGEENVNSGSATAEIDGTLRIHSGEAGIWVGAQLLAKAIILEQGLLHASGPGSKLTVHEDTIIRGIALPAVQTVRIENGASADLQGNVSLLSGEMEIANAELIVGSGANGGTLTIGAPNQVEPPPPLHITAGGSLHTFGDVDLWGKFQVGDQLTGTGTASVAGDINVHSGEVAIMTPEDLPPPNPASISASSLNLNRGTVHLDRRAKLDLSGNLIVGSPNADPLLQKVRIEAGAHLQARAGISIHSGEVVLETDATLAAPTAQIGNAGVLEGSGSIDADISNHGMISPGLSAGQMMIVGNYEQYADGVLDIELGGLASGSQYDALAITGTATLSGLLEVSLIDIGTSVFEPELGQTFEILTATDGVNGQFALVNLPPLAADLNWDIAYGPNHVLLQVIGSSSLPGDYNSDGRVNAADYVSWRKNDRTQVGYDMWRANFGRTLARGSDIARAASANSTVPEPEAMLNLLAALATLWFIVAIRRHPNVTTREQ